MEKKMKKLIFLYVSILLLTLSGCGGGGEDDADSITNPGTETGNTGNTGGEEESSFDESLRGQWIYVHNGNKIYIDENFKYPITKTDDNLLTVQQSGTNYHLIRYGNDTTTVSGTIYDENGAQSSARRALQRSMNNIGSIDIILKHYKDEKRNKEKSIPSTGDFQFENVQTGKYTLEASTEDENVTVTAEVDIQGEEVTLGSFKLVSDDGYNFKTTYSIRNSKDGYIFGDQTTYTGFLLIKNIGEKKGVGLNYDFSTDSPYISSMSNDIVMGTVDVNKSIKVPFEITFNILDKPSVSVPIEVAIHDANGNKWNDTLFIHVYQTPMYLHIATQKANIKGYIIDEAHQLKQVNTGDATITLPYLAGKSYYLVLSNPTINNETAYSIGLDIDAEDFEGFQNTSVLEPNNKESEATSINMRESIISYLHEGDIDYFKLNMNGDADAGIHSPPQIPFR